MRKQIVVALVLSLISTTVASAAAVNTSKSNNYRLTYHADIMSADQAKTLLAELEKLGRADSESVRKWLPENFKRLGINGSRVNKIDAFVVKGRKEMGILLLSDPNDEEKARAENLNSSKSD
jgi:hypothetical protein